MEEVQFRLGLMSLVVASGTVLFRVEGPALNGFGIGVSVLLFALFHLVGARQIELADTATEKLLIIVDNAWGGFVFGWLFARYGLAAAMVSHALFHVAWFPIEKRIHRAADGKPRDG